MHGVARDGEVARLVALGLSGWGCGSAGTPAHAAMCSLRACGHGVHG